MNNLRLSMFEADSDGNTKKLAKIEEKSLFQIQFFLDLTNFFTLINFCKQICGDFPIVTRILNFFSTKNSSKPPN